MYTGFGLCEKVTKKWRTMWFDVYTLSLFSLLSFSLSLSLSLSPLFPQVSTLLVVVAQVLA